MAGVHTQLRISALADLGADPAIPTPMALTEVAPPEFMADGFCACELFTQNLAAGATHRPGFPFRDKQQISFYPK